MNNRIRKLPDHQLHFPHLDTFLIRSNHLSVIPDDFFGGMKEVKVLDMSLNDIISLPKSLKLLTKLITLDLSGNESLDEISILGELKDLEILKVRGTGIKVIPKEIGQLIKLRLLDAGECYDLSDVTPGVISKLTWLEELYIGTDEENAVSRLCLMEIRKLKFFRALHFSTNSNACHLFPEGTYFEKLQEFFFQFIDIDTERFLLQSDFDRSKSHLERRLRIARSKFPFKMPIKKLFQVSDGIELDYIQGLDNIIPDLYGESTIDKLKAIELYSSENVSCLVKTTIEDEDATKEKLFSQVEQIRLHDLKNLKLLFDCSFHYISLRNLQDITISSCSSLLTVFPLSVAQGLYNLRRIHIWDCSSLVVVISGGDEQTTVSDIEQTEDIEIEVGIHDANIEFRWLARIDLTNLPQLKSFYSGDSTIKYPSLKFIQVKNCPSMKSTWGHGVDDMLNVDDTPNLDDTPNHNFTPKEGELLPIEGELLL
ncbi:hypothetical protein Lser_V15G39995 [Lactuca serriola]